MSEHDEIQQPDGNERTDAPPAANQARTEPVPSAPEDSAQAGNQDGASNGSPDGSIDSERLTGRPAAARRPPAVASGGVPAPGKPDGEVDTRS